MRFKVGDKIEFIEDYETAKVGDVATVVNVEKYGVHFDRQPDHQGYCMFKRIQPYKQYKTDAEIMQELIEGRNNKPNILEGKDMNQPIDDPIEPQHYRKGEIDLFESWYRTYPLNEFRVGMQMIAERYMKRDKDNRIQDLDKAIYTLQRLREYEEKEVAE